MSRKSRLLILVLAVLFCVSGCTETEPENSGSIIKEEGTTSTESTSEPATEVEESETEAKQEETIQEEVEGLQKQELGHEGEIKQEHEETKSGAGEGEKEREKIIFDTNIPLDKVSQDQSGLQLGVSGYEFSILESTGIRDYIPCQNADLSNGFKITFDYRFDNGYFSENPNRKKALEAAAGFWERIIKEDMPEIPAQTLEIENKESGQDVIINIDSPIDDLLIMVFAWEQSENSKAYGGTYRHRGTLENSDNINARDYSSYLGHISINTSPYRPWFFDDSIETSSDLPSATHYDFISTAIHELGHALGFLTSAYSFLEVSQSDSFSGFFSSQWNEGKSIPLEKDSSHINWSMQKGLPRPTVESHVMHGSLPIQGLRFLPTHLDAMMLRDIGYEIREECIPPQPQTQMGLDPRIAEFKKQLIAESIPNPVGKWQFDHPRYLFSAWKGYPARIVSAKPEVLPVSFVGGLTVPTGTYLMLTHDMEGPKYSDIKKYSLVLDIRLPEIGKWYSLYNTNVHNRNAGEAWINLSGQIGQGDYSEKALQANRWYQIVLTVNMESGLRKYYVDGELWHTNLGDPSTRFEINGKPDSGLALLLLADNDGEDGTMDIAGAELYSRVLSDDEVKNLMK